MSSICPLCNGLENLGKECPRCHALCLDKGPVSGFAGPYSPYEETEVLAASGSHADQWCIHLAACPECGWDCRIAADLIEV
jgi:hypothetical protein